MLRAGVKDARIQILVTGFLGAGKTTLVRAMLAEPTWSSGTAVIVNEFGDVGVDGTILSEGGVDLIELSNGCLCCTLRDSAETALTQLMARSGIERIVIEASGAAVPIDLKGVLARHASRDDISLGPHVGVIDAARFLVLDRMLGEFLEHQIRNADLVLLNKSDAISSETLAQVRARVASVQPQTKVLTTVHCALDIPYWLSQGRHQLPAEDESQGTPSGIHGAAHLAFESRVLRMAPDLPAGWIERCFDSTLPGLMRAKGFVCIEGRGHLVQYAGDAVELTPDDHGREPELLFIGLDLDVNEIERRFGAWGTWLPMARLSTRRSGQRLASMA